MVRRILLVALILGLALFAALRAVGASIARGDPVTALRIDSANAVAIVADIDHRLADGGASLTAAMLNDSGRRALRAAPLSAGGLRALGLGADGGKDHPRARRLMQMALRVSRRDLGTHAWMIEDRVAAGDIAGALDHYDLALSTNANAPGLLFPVLSAALEDPGIQAAFAPLMAQKRPWMPIFLTYAIVNSAQPQGLANMVMAHGGLPRDPAYRPIDTLMLRRLDAAKRYDTAYRYALSLPGVRAATMTDVGFAGQSLDLMLAPLTWQLSEESDTRAIEDGDGRVTVLATPNSRGVAAVRMLFLRPGTYRFSQSVEPLPDHEPTAIAWELRCLSGKTDLVWQQQIPAARSVAAYPAMITVPGDCSAQRLSLLVMGGDSQSETGVRLGPIGIAPAVAR